MDTATDHAARIDGYAGGLLALFRAEGEADALVDEFYRAVHAVEGDTELYRVLTDPQLPVERKRAVVADLLGPRASRVVVAAFDLLLATGNEAHLTEIASRLAELAAAEQGAVVAEVRSAAPLDDGQVRRLEEALGRAVGRAVHAEVVVDPDLLGGVVAQVGDMLFDGSVKGRLEELKERWG